MKAAAANSSQGLPLPDSFLDQANQLLGEHLNLRHPFRGGSTLGLVEATRSVVLALGGKLPPQGIDARSPEEVLQRLLQQAKLRRRTVQLQGEWFRQDAGPFLGFLREGELPVALICEKGKHYRMLDPRSGESTVVNEELAARLLPAAEMFYRPLPDGPISALGLLRFALQGQGNEIALIMAVGLLAALLSLLIPLMTQVIVGDIIPQAERRQLFDVALALVVASVVAAMFRVTSSFAILRIEGKGDHAAQTALWDRLLRLPASFYQSYTAGDLTNRVDGINAIRQALSTTTVNYLLGAIFATANFFLILHYSWKLAVVALILALLAGVIELTVAFVQLPFHRRSLHLGGQVAGRLFQVVSGVAKWKAAAAEDRALGRWAEIFVAKKQADKWVGYIRAIGVAIKQGYPILTTLVNFGVFYFFLQGTLTTGQFLGYNAAFTQMLVAILSATGSTVALVNILPVFERVRPILESPLEQIHGGEDPGKLSGHIEVRNVGFKYPGDGPTVLKNVSFVIKPGEFVALVGVTGCGKSTLLRLLLGFAQPTLGEIYFDHRELRNLDLAAVRRQFGVVLQQDKIVAGDIYHNIVGSHPCGMDQAWKAAERASLKEDIAALPMGMHTYVSETGSTFSGGQIQRMIIARAIVHEPKILFFDEATSSLDNLSQATVSRNIRDMQVTRLVIAQRISTIREADRILVLHDGEIAQSGTFDELAEADGVFRHIVQRQMI